MNFSNHLRTSGSALTLGLVLGFTLSLGLTLGCALANADENAAVKTSVEVGSAGVLQLTKRNPQSVLEEVNPNLKTLRKGADTAGRVSKIHSDNANAVRVGSAILYDSPPQATIDAYNDSLDQSTKYKQTQAELLRKLDLHTQSTLERLNLPENKALKTKYDRGIANNRGLLLLQIGLLSDAARRLYLGASNENSEAAISDARKKSLINSEAETNQTSGSSATTAR